MNEEIRTIKSLLPEGEILAQLGEEASELSQAALKLRRVITKGASPTPTSKMEAMANFVEELADIKVCLGVLGYNIGGDINHIADEKLKRWRKRLEEAEKIK